VFRPPREVGHRGRQLGWDGHDDCLPAAGTVRPRPTVLLRSKPILRRSPLRLQLCRPVARRCDRAQRLHLPGWVEVPNPPHGTRCRRDLRCTAGERLADAPSQRITVEIDVPRSVNGLASRRGRLPPARRRASLVAASSVRAALPPQGGNQSGTTIPMITQPTVLGFTPPHSGARVPADLMARSRPTLPRRSP